MKVTSGQGEGRKFEAVGVKEKRVNENSLERDKEKDTTYTMLKSTEKSHTSDGRGRQYTFSSM